MTDSLRSDLNDFLFTPIADDSNGMHLTMLSALARSGVDPWEEAAGLRALSRDDATDRLLRLLADVPNGPSPGDPAATLAARLVEQLHSAPKAPPRPISSASAANGADPPPLSFSALPKPVKVTIYLLTVLLLMIVGFRALISS